MIAVDRPSHSSSGSPGMSSKALCTLAGCTPSHTSLPVFAPSCLVISHCYAYMVLLHGSSCLAVLLWLLQHLAHILLAARIQGGSQCSSFHSRFLGC